MLQSLQDSWEFWWASTLKLIQSPDLEIEDILVAIHAPNQPGYEGRVQSLRGQDVLFASVPQPPLNPWSCWPSVAKQPHRLSHRLAVSLPATQQKQSEYLTRYPLRSSPCPTGKLKPSEITLSRSACGRRAVRSPPGESTGL